MTRQRAFLALTTAVVLLAGPVASASADSHWSDGTAGSDHVSTEAVNVVPVQQGGQQTGPRPAPGSNAGGQTQVDLPDPPCQRRPWLSGPAMAEYAATYVVPMAPPPANWQDHAEDPNGAWYRPECRFTTGTPDALTRQAEDFRRDNPVAWFTSPPPPPPIPVADLVEIVRDSQRLPALVVSTNPDGQTVVGLRTWVWPTGGDFGPVTSRAQSGPNWAQVTATPSRLRLTSSDPRAEVGSCATAPAWSQGVSDDATDCYVTFRRSSAGRAGQAHTISVQMTWEIRLTTSDGRNELLAIPPVVTDVSVPVAQVQSVLR